MNPVLGHLRYSEPPAQGIPLRLAYIIGPPLSGSYFHHLTSFVLFLSTEYGVILASILQTYSALHYESETHPRIYLSL